MYSREWDDNDKLSKCYNGNSFFIDWNTFYNYQNTIFGKCEQINKKSTIWPGETKKKQKTSKEMNEKSLMMKENKTSEKLRLIDMNLLLWIVVMMEGHPMFLINDNKYITNKYKFISTKTWYIEESENVNKYSEPPQSICIYNLNVLTSLKHTRLITPAWNKAMIPPLPTLLS